MPCILHAINGWKRSLPASVNSNEMKVQVDHTLSGRQYKHKGLSTRAPPCCKRRMQRSPAPASHHPAVALSVRRSLQNSFLLCQHVSLCVGACCQSHLSVYCCSTACVSVNLGIIVLCGVLRVGYHSSAWQATWLYTERPCCTSLPFRCLLSALLQPPPQLGLPLWTAQTASGHRCMAAREASATVCVWLMPMRQACWACTALCPAALSLPSWAGCSQHPQLSPVVAHPGQGSACRLKMVGAP